MCGCVCVDMLCVCDGRDLSMIVHFRPGAGGKLRFEAREEKGDSCKE